jgi:phosphoglycerate kinase
MQSIKNISNIKHARVLIRVDYNVPLKGNRIIDARRIEASYKTIDFILKKGGTPVLIAHVGDGKESLRPVATYLSKKYKMVLVSNDIFDHRTKDILHEVPPHTIILLENIRRYEGEEKNDRAFAKALASLGEYYVNDAFSVSHRKHASIVGMPALLPSFAGFQLEEEIKALSLVTNNPKHPFIFMLGGAKFATKIPLIKQFMETADAVVISGAILNIFYKAAGFEVGKSVVEEGYDAELRKLLRSPKLLLPVDVIVLRNTKKVTVTSNEVAKDDVIVDIGPQSVALIAARIKKAKLVVWNGPTGWYERGFTKATTELAHILSDSTAQVVIGGGDTGAVIEKILGGTNRKNLFISTGGGATLAYLSKKTLPGITALGK